MEMFLSVFDNIRFMTGLLVANLLFIGGVAVKRSYFWLRIALGAVIFNVIAVVYVFFPVYEIGESFYLAVLLGIWWIFLTLLGCLYSYICFRVTPTEAIFYGVQATTLQQIATVVIRYWFVNLMFPEFPAEHPAIYVLFTVLVYAAIYLIAYFVYIRRLHKKKVMPDNTLKNFIIYLVILLILSVVTDLTTGVYEVLIPDIVGISEKYILLLKYFCIGIQLLICFVVFIIQYSAYSINSALREKALTEYMFRERSRQYEVQKEAINVIKRQAHDLRHQIRALEHAPYEDRQKVIGSIKEAIDTYDKIIRTDDEVLSTILSEYSLQCGQRNIKLSCNIMYGDCSFIDAIDLYTMLGNALENATESVSAFETDEKKTISFTVEKKGNILCFMVENYYLGNIVLADGLPVTTKRDRELHGIGIQSIKSIAVKYGGDILVDVGEGIFTLQIMIPITLKK